MDIHFSTIILYPLGAILLDLLLGDPRWFPHPVRLIGALATIAENISRRFIRNERLAGLLTLVFLLLITGLSVMALLRAAAWLHPLLGHLTSVFLLYTTLAARDLTEHSKEVYDTLRDKDLIQARQRVAMIVGRDTSRLDQAGVSRATVESVAENMVDGVTAPLFYGILAGPVGAMLYKVINTGDSMFGYKNEKYIKFGWASARLDDLANFIPARLTGLLVPVASFLLGLNAKKSLEILIRDRKKHASPNSGHSEAAVAGALGIQLGGASRYFGKTVVKPTLGDADNPINYLHIWQAIRIMLLTSALAALLFLAIRLLFEMCWI